LCVGLALAFSVWVNTSDLYLMGFFGGFIIVEVTWSHRTDSPILMDKETLKSTLILWRNAYFFKCRFFYLLFYMQIYTPYIKW